MKSQDKVLHKLTGQQMTIKKVFGGVASCFIDGETEWNYYKQQMVVKTAVCSVENLELL